MTKKITTHDVARLAGVSVTTVSRVMNQSDHPVNSETAKKVRDAVQKLGFTPSALAKALVTRRSGIIGALVGDNADPYFATIAHGVHSAARKHHSIAILCNTLRDPQAELDFFTTLDQYRADGLLLAGGELMDPDHNSRLRQAVEAYRSHGGFVVALSEQDLPVPSVHIDNCLASYDMARYLISLGHERIGYVRGPRNLKTTALRENGFLEAMQEAGLSVEPAYRADGDFSFEGGLSAAIHLLNLPDPPTAIFTANDISALGCLVAAQRIGLAVPADLSVAGMDNIEATCYVDPPLTTVQIPMEEMGVLGVELLQAALHGNPVPPETVLPHTLIVRGTTGPVKKTVDGFHS